MMRSLFTIQRSPDGQGSFAVLHRAKPQVLAVSSQLCVFENAARALTLEQENCDSYPATGKWTAFDTHQC